MPEVSLLRIMAIILILHSHSSELYPSAKWVFGNHLGNSVFYFVSGFGLALSFQKNPQTVSMWLIKRTIMISVPLVAILYILSLGNLSAFGSAIVNYAFWNKVDGFIHFLPVLWLNYLLFIPASRLDGKKLVVFFGSVMVFAASVFIFKVYSGQAYGVNLPSSGLFFILSATGCFTAGMILSRIDLSKVAAGNWWNRLALLSVIVISQLAHREIIRTYPHLVLLNYYLNILCVTSMFLFMISLRIKYPDYVQKVISEISKSSMAVYLVHFTIITWAQRLGLLFPYSIVYVMTNSIIWSYGITHFTQRMSDYAFGSVQRLLSGTGKEERAHPESPLHQHAA